MTRNLREARVEFQLESGEGTCGQRFSFDAARAAFGGFCFLLGRLGWCHCSDGWFCSRRGLGCHRRRPSWGGANMISRIVFVADLRSVHCMKQGGETGEGEN